MSASPARARAVVDAHGASCHADVTAATPDLPGEVKELPSEACARVEERRLGREARRAREDTVVFQKERTALAQRSRERRDGQRADLRVEARHEPKRRARVRGAGAPCWAPRHG
eukprot:6201595-Pleurochrysis_carterae.AAC.2